MKKYFQHFQTFHTHQKICSLSERDVTISYSMDFLRDDSEKSSFSNSKVGMHDSHKMRLRSNTYSIIRKFDLLSIGSIVSKIKSNRGKIWIFQRKMI